MKAVFLHGPRDLRVEEAPDPKPGNESVVIRVHRASVCNGSDAAVYSGRRDRETAYPWMELPWILGHECAGEIVEVGGNVDGFKVGDRVASLKYGNAFAEYQSACTSLLMRVPEGMSYDQATYLEPLWATMSYVMHTRPGDSVVVCGLGPSGLLLMQEAIGAGAAKVCAVDRHPLRLQMAEKLGASLTIKVTDDEDAADQILEKFGEPDVFIDATGYDVYDAAVKVLKNGGRLVMYGVPDSGVHYDGTRAFFKGIKFCRGDKSPAAGTTEKCLDVIARGEIELGNFTTHHFPLEQVPQAVELVLEHPDQAIGVVIDVC